MSIIEQYLLQLNTEKRQWRRAVVILSALSLIVALVTGWNLRLTGITIANSASCGYEEHLHSDECSQKCDIEEHIHSISCYSDPNADVETAEDWEATLPDDLGRYWSENLARIAESQLGYKESESNYILDTDGVTKRGITRYGQWYGNPYGDWSAMFVAFCLNYADVPTEAIPRSPGVYTMMQLCEEKLLVSKPDEYTGQHGNILFVDTDGNGNADKMLIVTVAENVEESSENTISAIGGDWNDSVERVEISKNDPRILGYIPTAAVRDVYLNSLPLYSINKNNNVYTIDIYAIPVNSNGNRISALPVSSLGQMSVGSDIKISVAEYFDHSLGEYHSAYFGSERTASVNNINTVWRNKQGNTYYLAYAQTNGTQNTTWKRRADASISLYLRYIPKYPVTFSSDGFESIVENVKYNEYPTLTEPNSWSRAGYNLIGWLASDNQTVYTYEELLARPITSNVTYTAQWEYASVKISFDLGAYTDLLYAIEPMEVAYGGVASLLPTPGWKNNTAVMAFDGWYLDSDLKNPVSSDYAFCEDTTLYAKWSPKEDGYYIYFMDFAREGQTPLVLMTYSVTEGHTASSYTPGNEPEGTQWDGRWYLESSCTNAFNFSIPISQMKDHLTGANGRDLYLYPGTQEVCRAIFVTYGTRIDPVTVLYGSSINIDQYRPERDGYTFSGWTLKDGTAVSGSYTFNETTTFYAKWESGYVSFEAILRIENANDVGMTQAEILGTWYALSGSQIRVNSTYSETGGSRTGTHKVVCVLNGKEYPVYTNAALTRQATLDDVYSTYFIYNNSGTSWTDDVNWDDVYTGGELPYSTRPISSAGDTIINFDYMRVRNDVVFTIPNSNSGAYIDIYKLQSEGLITGSVIYTGTKPTSVGKNVSATGVSSTNVSWTYTAASNTTGSNTYTLHNLKYGQRLYEVYPVGGSWLTTRDNDFHWYRTDNDQLFASRREDLSSDFFSGSGRKVATYGLKAEFADQNRVALMYAMECLVGESPDFTINGVGYKVQTQLCEVVNHTGDFSIKELLGCKDGVNPLANQSTKYYSRLNSSTATIGGTSVKTLFGSTYWSYYGSYVTSLSEIDRAYIFYYDRMYMNIQFNFAYDANGNGSNEIVEYENIAFGEKIDEYQFGMANYEHHSLLEREGYEFAGWLDANGYVLEAEDWDSMISTGDSENSSMIFIAKWEKLSNNIVEYYEDRSAEKPFESHYFDDGELMQFPTMAVYPEGWVWQEYGEGTYQRFDWDVPMYGEYGVQETRIINGVEVTVNVVRVYGTWDESHTKIVYDPNAAQGGVPGSAPTDDNEYTIWQSDVSVKEPGGTSNSYEDMIFVGWLLDRNGIVYQPGDHVPVRWPRLMIFTAQWAKVEEVVSLRYDSNGGLPNSLYPDNAGFTYKKNANASVWNNADASGNAWFVRPGYTFAGWNTEPDGSGTAYAPGSSIVLTQAQTTLYAQWKSDTHTLSLHKIDSEGKSPLAGAIFTLYGYENGAFASIQSLTTGTDGRIILQNIRTDVLYKLTEERPPDGYAIITRDIFFKIIPEGNTVTFVFCDSAGNTVITPRGVTGEYVTANKILSLTVENLKGYALPSTGGMGTHIYILCGLALMITPFIYAFERKRKYERRPSG